MSSVLGVRRRERISELIRREVSVAIDRDMKDPLILGLVSVTHAETSPDLSHTRIFISIIGTEEEKSSSIAALNRASGFIRHLLGERIRLKRIPEIAFQLDESLERGGRVLRLLKEI